MQLGRAQGYLDLLGYNYYNLLQNQAKEGEDGKKEEEDKKE